MVERKTIYIYLTLRLTQVQVRRSSICSTVEYNHTRTIYPSLETRGSRASYVRKYTSICSSSSPSSSSITFFFSSIHTVIKLFEYFFWHWRIYSWYSIYSRNNELLFFFSFFFLFIFLSFFLSSNYSTRRLPQVKSVGFPVFWKLIKLDQFLTEFFTWRATFTLVETTIFNF